METKTSPTKPKPAKELSDDELFDEIREQVNLSRVGGGHNRTRTRALGREARRRGWLL